LVTNDEAVLAPPLTVCPPRRWPGLDLAETWRLRAVCLVLAQRLLKVRYRQAGVGVAWALIQPILLMIAFTIFFGLFARLPSEGVAYPLFFFSGLALWQVTSKLMSEGSNSVVANTALVTRIYFPRVYFPTAVALSSMVDLLFNSVALVLLMIYFGSAPGAEIVALPLILAIVYATSLGLALWLSALNVAFRDVTVLVPFIAQVGFFLSPIIYPASIVPAEYQTLYFANPMALAIEAFRWSLLGTPAPPLSGWIVGSLVAVLLLFSGYVFFRQREGTFSDVI
jgi:lipopolysaccharide transport system permease protein